MEALADYGYIGLFITAFLAATMLPVSSEVLLVWMAANGYHPALLVLWATAGNVLGAILNYWIGYGGNRLLFQRVLRIPEKQITKAEARFQKYGVFSLLLAWAPVIGDPLTIVAGLSRINIWIFTILVLVGKFVRYYILVLGVDIFS